MKIPVGISNHHVHLTKEHYDILFYEEIEVKYLLKQTGEFASNQKVNIKVDDKIIENVRVVGPFRNYTQIELLNKDCEYLNINAPVRNSGDLCGAQTVELIGPKGVVNAKESTIIANKHIHFPLSELTKTNYKDGDIVSVKTKDNKIINNVHIKAKDDYILEFHINKDEASVYNLENNQEVVIC